jgi:hypothetical protein
LGVASYVDAQFIEHEIEIVRTADENAHVRLDRTITARVVWELECHIGALFGVVQSAEAAVSVEPMLGAMGAMGLLISHLWKPVLLTR